MGQMKLLLSFGVLILIFQQQSDPRDKETRQAG